MRGKDSHKTDVAQSTPTFPNSSVIRYACWVIFSLAALLYSNTLSHGFVLDDSMMITKNKLTTQGVHAVPQIFANDMALGEVGQQKSTDIVVGGRYRPLSVSLFAVIYSLVQAKPFLYHLANVLLYAAACALFFITLMKWLKGSPQAAQIALISAGLFMIHPLHTEVVANIKSNDEILALLLGLLAWNWSLDYVADQRKSKLALSAIALLASCLAKENALAFVALIPLSIYVIPVSSEQPLKRPALSLLGSLFAGAVVFLLIRSAVVGVSLGKPPMNLINNAFIKFVNGAWVPFTTAEHLATVLYTLGKYVLLFVFPHPLTTDYYPRHVAIMHFSDWQVLAGLAVNLFLLGYALVGLLRGNLNCIRYGILFWFVSLFMVSNIPFSLGTNMAERFAFLPSTGFCIAVGALLASVWNRHPKIRTLINVGLVLICMAYCAKTLIRNRDYRDNRTLVEADIKISYNSAKMQNAAGSLLVSDGMTAKDETARNAYLKRAVGHFDKALEIYPTYAEAFYGRASANFLLKDYPRAITDFQTSLKIAPDRPEIKNNLGVALFEVGKSLVEQNGDMNLAAEYLRQADQLFPNVPQTVHYLGMAYFKMGDLQEATARFDQEKKLMTKN